MQRLSIIIMALMLTFASSAYAATVWNPAANGIYPPATGNWNDKDNWTGGVPVTVTPGNTKAVWNVTGAAECVVTDARNLKDYVQGDGGPGGMVRITNGATVSTSGGWMSVGYNRAAKLIVEQGGVLNCGGHMWNGMHNTGIGTIELNGGTINVAENFGLGWYAGTQNGTAYFYVNSGELNLDHWNAAESIHDGSFIDIDDGTVTIRGNQISAVAGYVAAGKITGYDGTGDVRYDYNVTNFGRTTIWAEPSTPEYGTGDINGDGDVNEIDMALMAGQWLQIPGEPSANCNLDGEVNLEDFQILANNWKHNEFSQTLTGKVMCGYQGWFNCPNDGANRGWVHWGKSGRFEPNYCSVDMWPDMSEYDADEKFPTGFKYADGSTAHVFSSHNEKTVLRHFKWMEEYGIDGIFLQRFATETNPGSSARNNRDQIMLHCRKAGNQHKRAWAMMYDISGLGQGGTQRVIDDWKHLVDSFGVGKDPMDSAYLRHGGKPVIAIWGIGFTNRDYTLDECLDMVNFFKNDPDYGGMTVMLGVPSYWRELKRDCVNDSKVHDIILAADIVSPWAVGRFGSIHTSELDYYANNVWKPDVLWCNQNNKEYLPVVFPGFSWQNLQDEKFDHIPRRGGSFLWRQYYKAIEQSGATMVYQAMFDEVDEGTAIFKCTNTPPVGSTPFLPTGNPTYPPFDIDEANLPSDHYLWLVGQAKQMLTGQRVATETMPIRQD